MTDQNQNSENGSSDMEWDAESSSELRIEQYKEILMKILDTDNTADSLSSMRIVQIVSQLHQKIVQIENQGSIQDRIGCNNEVVLDSLVMQELVMLLKRVMVRFGGTFNDQVFVIGFNKLINTENGQRNWLALTDEACKIAKTARLKPTLLGAIDVEAPADVVRARAARVRPTQTLEKRPEEVNALKTTDKGHQKVQLLYKQMLAILNKMPNKRVAFYHLITHPTNLMISADNALQLAHLCKEKSIEIYKDSNGELWVEMSKENDTTANTSGCINVNTKLCREAVQKYNIKEPLLNLQQQNEANV